MLQQEHGFCQQNGPKRGQVQDWYPNENMMVVLFVRVIDIALQCAWVLYDINKDEGDETLHLLAFKDMLSMQQLKEIFKGRQIILQPCRNWKYPIRCLL